MSYVSRRAFTTTAIAGGIALSFPKSKISAQPPAHELRIRKSALDLPVGDAVFSKYAEAVKRMHELPISDRRNWRRQAEIHPDYCQHAPSLGFLPWHRHYITNFEKICGELIGDASFSLPYWDWTKLSGKIPDVFFDIPELDVTYWKDNGIYTGIGWGPVNTAPIRAIGRQVGVQDDPIRGGSFTPEMIDGILGETAFEDFSGRLETTPHNSGHVVVGIPNRRNADVGHIGDGLSPLDPLFWLHHCNVDRLWALWQLAGNTMPTVTGNYVGNFVNETGQPIDVNAQDAFDFESMGFTYEDFGAPRPFLMAANATDPIKSAEVSNQPIPLGQLNASNAISIGSPKTFPVSVQNLEQQLSSFRTERSFAFPAGEPKQWTAEGLQEFGLPKETPRRIQAVFKNVRTTSKQPPTVNVFLNCPYLSPTTPYTDTHYAGTFSFFGTKHNHSSHEGEKGFQVIIDLTKPLQDLGLAKANDIKVQMLPLFGEGDVVFDSMEIRSS